MRENMKLKSFKISFTPGPRVLLYATGDLPLSNTYFSVVGTSYISALITHPCRDLKHIFFQKLFLQLKQTKRELISKLQWKAFSQYYRLSAPHVLYFLYLISWLTQSTLSKEPCRHVLDLLLWLLFVMTTTECINKAIIKVNVNHSHWVLTKKLSYYIPSLPDHPKPAKHCNNQTVNF